MHIRQLHIKNFRSFADSGVIELHPKFNLFIGINGTGKTTVLEALRIAVGSLFLEMDKVADHIYTPHIKPEDVRLGNLEKQYPVSISAQGIALGTSIKWTRELMKEGGRTRYVDDRKGERSTINQEDGSRIIIIPLSGNDMKGKSAQIQRLIREANQSTPIPLIAYYSTDRYKREKYDTGSEPAGSRLRGYYNSMDAKTNLKFFLDFFRTEAFAEVQTGQQSTGIVAVKQAVGTCIENCEEIVYDIRRDKLLVKTTGNDVVPFDMLSDGVRCMLSMVMEIAFRCWLLNPWLGSNAAIQTPGVILIDEIDLHIHPSWQRKIINGLQTAFPALQFMASTHAPVVVSSMKNGKIHALKDHQVYPFPQQFGRDANSVIIEMGGENRQEEVDQKLKRYFLLIERGEGKGPEGLALRTELESILGRGTADPDLQRADALLSFFDE